MDSVQQTFIDWRMMFRTGETGCTISRSSKITHYSYKWVMMFRNIRACEFWHDIQLNVISYTWKISKQNRLWCVTTLTIPNFVTGWRRVVNFTSRALGKRLGAQCVGGWVGLFREEKSLFPILKLETRTVKPIAQSTEPTRMFVWDMKLY